MLGLVIRDQLKIPQTELAEIVGVSHDTLQKWLLGRSAMTVDQFAIIAHALGLKPSQLLTMAEREIVGKAVRPALAVVGDPA